MMAYKRTGHLRPLQCYRCVRDGVTSTLTATGAQQMLNVDGEKRLHADLYCSRNHAWWSRHPEALAMARAADQAAKDKAGTDEVGGGTDGEEGILPAARRRARANQH